MSGWRAVSLAMLESLINFSFSTARCWRNLNSHWLLLVLGRNSIFFFFCKLLESVTWLMYWVGQLIPCSSLSGFSGSFSILKKEITVKCLLPLSSLCAFSNIVMVVTFNLLYKLCRQPFSSDAKWCLPSHCIYVSILWAFLSQVY